jgi:hypothetical protein
MFMGTAIKTPASNQQMVTLLPRSGDNGWNTLAEKSDAPLTLSLHNVKTNERGE